MKALEAQRMSATGKNTAPEQIRSVRNTLRTGIATLRDAQVPSFTLAAEHLLLHVVGCDRTWLYAHPEAVVSDEDAQRFFALLARRAAGVPTQHLTGKQEFWGFEFEVTPDVLIPRPETEHVIEVILDRLAVHEIRAGRKQTLSGEGLRIADVGTGSGCIAVVLAKELPAATIYATDISNAALSVAQRNAARHSVSGRIHFIESNLLDQVPVLGAQHAAPLLGTHPSAATDQSQVTTQQPLLLDLIASNPPYIGRREAATLMREVRDHEPEVALYGGEQGYELYADLIAQSAVHLKPGGIIVFELGHNTLPAVQPLLDASTWTNVSVTNDLAGTPRVIAAERL
jgi:release factor glutamine methyltransferase